MNRARTVSVAYTVFAIFMGVAAGAMLPGCNRGPDISTPKAAAASFAKAMETGDTDALKKTTKGTDAQFATVQKMAGMVKAAKHYQDALVSKFGDKAKADEMGAPKFAENYADAVEKIDGDKATVTPKSGEPIKLVKDSDGWKVDLAVIDAAGTIFDKMAKPMTDAFESAAKDVEDGKFKTAEEANAAFIKKMGSMR
ncbi:MAG TPA: hypothetical protein VFE47_00630 [Tepidisphaeraceae bacterium]|jgi:hypothetical protein|nr:hypothetical protein [Tepidisphaeraceae bacterium]